MQATMTVTLVDVELTYDGDTTIETSIGVLKGEWNDGMIDTALDSKTYFLFDDLSEIVVGAETGDGDTITKILSEPYEATETYEVIEGDYLTT